MIPSMPFNGMRYAHKAIRAEVVELERLAGQLSGATGEEIDLFLERLSFFRVLTRSHTDGEEEILWPVLESKYPEITVPYTLDHRAEQGIFAAIGGVLDKIASGASGEARKELERELARDVTALSVTLSHHSQKEDQHLIPVVERSFSLAEQEEYAGRSVAHLPKALMPRIVPMVVGSLALDERVDFLRAMRRAQPPAVFEQGTARWVKAALPEPEWTALADRLPGLAAA